MSAEASDMSSWLLMGLPGVAYLTGIADAGWTAIGLGIGTYLNWLIVAQRLRRYSIVCNAITIPDFFSRRFKDDKNILMCISAIIILVFFIPYTASGFKAIGTLFSSLFGTDYHIAMIVGAVVIVGYTVMGGFMAVSTTDLIQSVVMSISLVVIVFYGIHMAGGWSEVVNNATSLAGYLSITQLHDRATASAAPYGLLSIVSTVAWGLGYFGMPHILLRFMAIEEEKKLVLSRRIATVWVLISMCVAILIGIIGYGASVAGSIPMFTTSSQSETVIIQFAHLLGQNGPGLFKDQNEHCRFHECSPSYGYGNCHCSRFPGMEPGQLCIHHRILCMGRFWSILRTAGAVRPLLAPYQYAGRTGRYAYRRRYGLCMEVSGTPIRRKLQYL